MGKKFAHLFGQTSTSDYICSMKKTEQNCMKNKIILFFLILSSWNVSAKQQLWPDGTVMAEWFTDTTRVNMATLGKHYVVTDYGVAPDSALVQTRQLQDIIDRCAKDGGGVIVIPRGTFVSGSLFFKPGTHLMIEEGGTLKGSGHVEDFALRETRIEGETCTYFSALVNVDHADRFVLSGPGKIDGNGYHYWKQFWLRKKWNSKATNKDEQRPRLVYIANSHDVTIQDISLANSPFWTTHVYMSHHVRYLGCRITSSTTGVKAPSTDAIDLDACHDVHVHGCYMNVNDDAVVLKGGKGTWADKKKDNGPNKNILIENCHYGTVHGCLTLGSESIFNHNVILRDSRADNAHRVLWLKMRPDTPQHFQYVRIDNITGKTRSFLVVRPWTQFYNMEEREDMPLSRCNDITLSNIRMTCENFFDVGTSEKYTLSDFTFRDIDVTNQDKAFNTQADNRTDTRDITRDITRTINNTTVKNVRINGIKQ